MIRPSQRRRARRLRQRGFTLLEVLVATAILGVAVVTLLGLHGRNLSLSAEAETLTVAGTLAGDVLAVARLEPVIEVGATHGTFAARRSDADGHHVLYGGALSPDFVWTRDVMPTALPTLLQIRVRIHLAGEDRTLAELWAAVRAPGITTP
ncbi:MAG TPA: prepilin-type N-terminal cleavage/methylation domain-containing protein [Candidatus Limnocylindrales bacterium]|nr:prepilin-type N-terminal cleavage/methylation domain-containing protein [Candidatus Limnocylindrales bacterium]